MTVATFAPTALYTGGDRYGTPESPYRRDRSGKPVTTSTIPAPSAADASGVAFIRALFDQVFGGALTEFAEQAWREYNSGTPIEQILYNLRQTDAYAARFPGMKELQGVGRPITEAAYLDLERTYRQVGAGFDIPAAFFDTAYLGKVIGAEKSPAEFQRQLQDWSDYEKATRDPVAHAEIDRQFAAMGFAPSDGDYLMALLRPDVAPAHIEQRLRAGQVGAEAVRSGFGQIGLGQELTLADQGVSVDAARQTFGALSGATQLFGGLPGEMGAETLTQEQQVNAGFGLDAASARRLEAQRRRRSAVFEEGGGGLGRSGIAGLGSATA